LERGSKETAKRYIFVISRPSGVATDPESLIRVLEDLGIQVDREYGAVPVDPFKLRFALRGTANADVIERVERDSTIEILTDPQVESM